MKLGPQQDSLTPASEVTAEEMISRLQLKPHPEGGYYRETYREPRDDAERSCVSVIYYLLTAGERSHWHRVVDAEEVWLWHGGSSLRLHRSVDGKTVETVILGMDMENGAMPQAIIPAGAWQAASPEGGWVLVSCVVAPAFLFDTLELADPGFQPGYTV